MVVSCLFDYFVEGYIKTNIYRYDKFPKIVTARLENIMQKRKNTKIEILNYNTNYVLIIYALEQNFRAKYAQTKAKQLICAKTIYIIL
jgi:hypothetical protein